MRFFRRNKLGRLRLLPRNAPGEEILTAHSATLKLDNQKNGWRGVCVHQEANGEEFLCAVKALARRYIHLRNNNKSTAKEFMSAFWVDGIRYDVTDHDMRDNFKWAGKELFYPTNRGIPIERIDTHSLRGGGANALSLSGYSDTQIQKMGRWKGKTFKEYIREDLHCFSEGMSRNNKPCWEQLPGCNRYHDGHGV